MIKELLDEATRKAVVSMASDFLKDEKRLVTDTWLCVSAIPEEGDVEDQYFYDVKYEGDKVYVRTCDEPNPLNIIDVSHALTCELEGHFVAPVLICKIPETDEGNDIVVYAMSFDKFMEHTVPFMKDLIVE